MKFKNVFFRKMTILYSLIIGIMMFGIYFVITEATTTSVDIDQYINTATIIATAKKEVDKIDNAEIIGRTKRTMYLSKVDASLTGNECIMDSSYYSYKNVGDTIELEDTEKHTCVIKDFVKTGLYPYDLGLSQELYNSIKDDGYYYYVIDVNSLASFNKIEKNKDIDHLSIYNLDNEYFNLTLRYDFDLYIIGGETIVLFLIVIVLFINTKGYIKANTKKTRKKVKDNTLKLTVGSTVLTLVSGYITGSIITWLVLYIVETI